MKSFYTVRALRRAAQRAAIPRQQLTNPFPRSIRPFHASSLLQRLETHTLSDIGEGVKEVQIIQWFVEEGATVEEWAPLCEVQSDKASVEITSKYSGVIKKLHFETDAVVQVGDVMLDIEVEGEEEASEEAEPEPEPESKKDAAPKEEPKETKEPEQQETKQGIQAEETPTPEAEPSIPLGSKAPDSAPKSKHASLATPAVRGMLKQHGLDISEIEGTGKDGRVMKEDVTRHIEKQKEPKQQEPQQQPSTQQTHTPATSPALDAKQVETQQNLTPVQSAMFKTMTKSLSIPHFLYSDSINVTSLAGLRSRLNTARSTSDDPKLSYMPFVIKAVSLALNKYPILNARLDTSDAAKPKLLMRSSHNIGVAMDTPAGLIVPVIKNVNARSINSIARELKRLSELGAVGKLMGEDLKGGTITVSNIGSIGGGVVAPVIVEGQLAIMGMGKIKPVPVFAEDGVSLERQDHMSVSWSADHRAVDGATMARMATCVQGYLERPESMIVDLA